MITDEREWGQLIAAAVTTTCGHPIGDPIYWVTDRPDIYLCPVCVDEWRDTPSARRADRSPRDCAGCHEQTVDPVLVEFVVGPVNVLAWLCPNCLRSAS